MMHIDWKDLDQQDEENREEGPPSMSRMPQKTQPLRGKYVKKRPPVRRGIKHRRNRKMHW